MSEETEKPKVVSFKTRKAFDAAAEPSADSEQVFPPNPELIKALEYYLEQAKVGKHCSGIYMAWNEEYGAFDSAVLMPPRPGNLKDCWAYMGILQSTLIDVADMISASMNPTPDEYLDDA